MAMAIVGVRRRSKETWTRARGGVGEVRETSIAAVHGGYIPVAEISDLRSAPTLLGLPATTSVHAHFRTSASLF